MHGTYTHRITCNLYPVQYYTLERAAERAKMRLAPFVRDAALAYMEQKIVLPDGFQERIVSIHQELRRSAAGLSQIAERAKTIQRITHDDLRYAGEFVRMLDHQMTMFQNEIDTLPVLLSPHLDHQIDGS